MIPTLSTRLRRVTRFLKSLFAATLTFFVLNGSTCATIDPPPPEPLEAPRIVSSEVTYLPVNGKLREIIHLSWEKPSTNDLSVIEYRVIRKTPNDSTTTLLSIPSEANDLFDPADELDLSRLEANDLFYQLYAIDSLERHSDTSVICTVSLAPLVTLLSPKDSLTQNFFEWSVYNVANPCLSKLLLFSNNRLIWQSEPVNGFQLIGNDREQQYGISIPDSVYTALDGDNLVWAVNLQVVGAGDPASISMETISTGPDK